MAIDPDTFGPTDDLLVKAVRDFAACHRLSARETELLLMAAAGCATKEAAARLNIGIKTAECYWKRIYAKTRQSSQLAVVTTMFRRQLSLLPGDAGKNRRVDVC
jgi:DNA-binding CsgD family transcriptional regulator